MNMRQPQRRRGRGNNNNRSQNNNRNGYDNQNRVDNRARGNAAQMLEKYKKLAQDAQQNGDRVQAEYYHQFADHYFRVLADYRSRQEEGRPQREWRNEEREGGEDRDWRDEDRGGNDDGDNGEAASDDVGVESEDRRPQRDNRNDRNNRSDRNDRGERNERGERNTRPERSERNDRPQRGRNRDRDEAREAREPEAELGLDLSILPPAIGAANDEDSAPVAEEKPARKPRARKPKAASDEDVVAAAE